MSTDRQNGLPPEVREAIRISMQNRTKSSLVVISELAAAVRAVFPSADLDAEALEDEIASEAAQAQLAVEFDVNAHKH